MDVTLIKIGGSVITKKGNRPINRNAIMIIGQQLKGYKGKLIIVHGTGYVGKPPAIEYSYIKTKFLPKEKSIIAMRIRSDIVKMNNAFTTTLNKLDIPAISIDNTHFWGYFGTRWRKDPLRDLIENLTNLGTIPVFSGNFLPLANGGYRILSSDELVLAIARLITPRRVIFLSNVDGVLDKKGDSMPILKSSILKELADDPEDVSGGMRTKVKTALKLKGLCKECFIANGVKKGVLRNFLFENNNSGTKVF